MSKPETFDIQFEISNGYVGKSRPLSHRVWIEDYLDMDHDEIRDSLTREIEDDIWSYIEVDVSEYSFDDFLAEIDRVQEDRRLDEENES